MIQQGKLLRQIRLLLFFVVCLGVGFALLSGCQGAQGNGGTAGNAVEVVDISEPFDSLAFDEQYGGISVKEALSDGEQTYPLYATFDDKEKAFGQLALATSDVIELLQQEKGLASLDEGTVEGYRVALYETLNSKERPSWFNESNSEIGLFLQFVDIYENEAKNQEIKQLAQSKGIDAVMGMLPDIDD